MEEEDQSAPPFEFPPLHSSYHPHRDHESVNTLLGRDPFWTHSEPSQPFGHASSGDNNYHGSFAQAGSSLLGAPFLQQETWSPPLDPCSPKPELSLSQEEIDMINALITEDDVKAMSSKDGQEAVDMFAAELARTSWYQDQAKTEAFQDGFQFPVGDLEPLAIAPSALQRSATPIPGSDDTILEEPEHEPFLSASPQEHHGAGPDPSQAAFFQPVSPPTLDFSGVAPQDLPLPSSRLYTSYLAYLDNSVPKSLVRPKNRGKRDKDFPLGAICPFCPAPPKDEPVEVTKSRVFHSYSIVDLHMVLYHPTHSPQCQPWLSFAGLVFRLNNRSEANGGFSFRTLSYVGWKRESTWWTMSPSPASSSFSAPPPPPLPPFPYFSFRTVPEEELLKNLPAGCRAAAKRVGGAGAKEGGLCCCADWATICEVRKREEMFPPYDRIMHVKKPVVDPLATLRKGKRGVVEEGRVEGRGKKRQRMSVTVAEDKEMEDDTSVVDDPDLTEVEVSSEEEKDEESEVEW